MVYIFTPLSPRWLLIQCERTQARESLAKLRNLEPNSEIVNNEIEEIEDSLQQGRPCHLRLSRIRLQSIRCNCACCRVL